MNMKTKHIYRSVPIRVSHAFRALHKLPARVHAQELCADALPPRDEALEGADHHAVPDVNVRDGVDDVIVVVRRRCQMDLGGVEKKILRISLPTEFSQNVKHHYVTTDVRKILQIVVNFRT